jgi:glycosyltransferase involved in cell wall biosynthesis
MSAAALMERPATVPQPAIPPQIPAAGYFGWPLLFQWGFSTMFGWGVFGLNLLRHWESVAGTPVYCGGHMHVDSLAGLDPLAMRALMPKLIESSDLRSRWPAMMANGNRFDGLVLHCLGNRLSGSRLGEGGVAGRATCAVIFFEDTILPDATRIAADYNLIVAGSTWCEEILRARGVTNVATVIQGIDPSIFHPAPRAGSLEGRFAIFSGGKLENRKAQDLVLRAFVAFAQRHPEAILVTAWHSPWPVVAQTINRNPGIVPVALNDRGEVDVTAWARANGVGEHQFIDVGSIPNHLMARVLREMDVALFPNRCEGGTNLVAMECMACGVPTILSDNTGHKDILAMRASLVLTRQRPVQSEIMGTEGWGESDISEIVETLELVWSDRERARRIGAAGARAMARMSWRQQIGELYSTIAPCCA